MQTHVFYPASINYVKTKAKQLQRSFLGLRLSSAQEATAVALGFGDWFDCNKRLAGARNIRSLYDEELAHRERLMRRHHQFCALVHRASIAPFDAERFVRVWGLTSCNPVYQPSDFCSPYGEMEDLLKDFQSCPDDWETDDLPVRVADGILLGDMVKPGLTSFTLDQRRLMQVPWGVRGNASMFLQYEEGRLLPPFLEGVGPVEGADEDLRYAEVYFPFQYEWITGRRSNESLEEQVSGALIEEGQANAGSWYALSVRSRLSSLGAGSHEYYVPALRGEAFAVFIRSRGALNFNQVQWFKVESRSVLEQLYVFRFSAAKYLRLPAGGILPCDPLYHSPFKHGPITSWSTSSALRAGDWRSTTNLTTHCRRPHTLPPLKPLRAGIIPHQGGARLSRTGNPPPLTGCACWTIMTTAFLRLWRSFCRHRRPPTFGPGPWRVSVNGGAAQAAAHS